MRRRPVLVTAALLLATAAVLGGGVLVAAKQEPAFYTSATRPVDWSSREEASKLVTRVQDLKNDIRSQTKWGDTFGADALNSFFQENMGKKGSFAGLLPGGAHSPRVAIDGDRLKIGFKYGDGFWSTVAWVELKVWLVDGETNVVAVELCDLRAGLLPVGSQSVLDGISEAARDSNVDVTWYRNRNNPVGLFKFFADQPRPTSQILTLDVKDGAVTVAGRSFLDGPPPGPAAAGPDITMPVGVTVGE